MMVQTIPFVNIRAQQLSFSSLSELCTKADSNYLSSAFTSRLNEVKVQTKQYRAIRWIHCTLKYNEKGSHQEAEKVVGFKI